MGTALLDAKRIRTDGGTQHREAPDLELITEYADLLLDGAKLPPVEVVFDGTDYWLWDGFHRLAAHLEAGLSKGVVANIVKGSQQDAFELSLEANKAHGKRRSNETKRNAIKAALQNEVTAALEDKVLARKIGVSNHLVKAMRNGAERIETPARRAKAAAESGEISPKTEPEAGNDDDDDQGGEPPERQPGPVKVKTAGTVPIGSLTDITRERDGLRDQLDEMTQIVQELTDEMATKNAIIESMQGGGTAAAGVVAEVKQLQAQLRTAEERFNGANNERNEAVRLAKHYKRQLDKASGKKK